MIQQWTGRYKETNAVPIIGSIQYNNCNNNIQALKNIPIGVTLFCHSSRQHRDQQDFVVSCISALTPWAIMFESNFVKAQPLFSGKSIVYFSITFSSPAAREIV